MTIGFVQKSMLVLVVVLCTVCVTADVAQACPMCQAAVESEADNNVPKAYMYSILFMLMGPAALFIGFSYGIYKLSKRENAQLEAAAHLMQPVADAVPAEGSA
ncbi:MAG: hypothetical protein CMJ78_20085 [Planctomycetaceae bacterium]|nr:hypothetical protein [Planctomycetaceae bacterium]